MRLARADVPGRVRATGGLARRRDERAWRRPSGRRTAERGVRARFAPRHRSRRARSRARAGLGAAANRARSRRRGCASRCRGRLPPSRRSAARRRSLPPRGRLLRIPTTTRPCASGCSSRTEPPGSFSSTPSSGAMPRAPARSTPLPRSPKSSPRLDARSIRASARASGSSPTTKRAPGRRGPPRSSPCGTIRDELPHAGGARPRTCAIEVGVLASTSASSMASRGRRDLAVDLVLSVGDDALTPSSLVRVSERP